MADSSLRQLLILMRIPRYPDCVTTKEIYDYLEDTPYRTSIRTIQRDIQGLTLTFDIIDTPAKGRGKEGVGWAFSEKAANRGVPSMEPASALTMLMGYEHLKALLPEDVLRHITPYVREAEGVLKAFNQKNYANWMDKIRILPNSILQQPKVESKSVHNLYQALLTNNRVICTYNGKDEQEVSPYGIIQRANKLYLICKFFDYEDIRITAIQRYTNVEISNAKVKKDDNFDIDEYIGSGEMSWPWDRDGGQKPIKLKANVHQYLRNILVETPLSDDQVLKKTKDNEWYSLSASVVDSHELRFWLLSQGDSVEITSPKSMRAWFTEIASNMNGMYS